MSEKALEEVGRLLSRRVGLRLDPAVRGRLVRAVRDEAERFGIDESAYAATLDGDAERLQQLLNRVTVQETSFFRDAGQFAALANHVLPVLKEAGGPVHIWSAGCSNGQEPYSLAMTLVESGIPDWHVIASDLSTNALGRTRAGRYRERELRGLSEERRARFLVRRDDDWEVAPELRERVTAVRHNLAAESPPFPPGRCQVVFCRNVLIYFGHDDVVAFLDRLALHLPPTGFLFLGYSESLWQVSERFQLVRLGDAFVYQRATSGSAPPARSRPTAPVVERDERAPRQRVRRDPPARSVPRPDPPMPPEPSRAPANDEGSVDVRELMAAGEAAIDRGDHGEAVTAFRKAAFLDPDSALAHLNLGLALEVVGDDRAARRAYAAARAALERCDTAEVEATLEGYHLDDLVRLLDQKVGER